MTKGAVHPNGTNFRRIARLDVVARVRRLCESKLLAERPKWLEWCERVPPLENHNLKLQARTVRNPYPQMVRHVLKKYPDLRFQDCYVDGNDWSVGNDAYRDDHPVMQFVARQLDFMRTEGLSKQQAFLRTEELFRERRQHLEKEQKVMMAMALDSGVSPMFTTGTAYLQAERAKAEAAHMNRIRRRLRELKTIARERHEREREQQEVAAEKLSEEGQQERKEAAQPTTFRERRDAESQRVRDLESQRQRLIGRVAKEEAEEAKASEEPEKEPEDEEQALQEPEKKASVEEEAPSDRGAQLLQAPRTVAEAPVKPPPDIAPPPEAETIVVHRRRSSADIDSMLDQKQALDAGTEAGVMGEDREKDDDYGLERAVKKRQERRRGFGPEERGFGDEGDQRGGRGRGRGGGREGAGG